MAVAVLYVEYRQRVLMRVITTRSEPSKEEEPPVDLKLSEGGEQYRTVNEKREIPTIRGPNSQEVAFYKSHGLA
jgi:hypothetical protein